MVISVPLRRSMMAGLCKRKGSTAPPSQKETMMGRGSTSIRRMAPMTMASRWRRYL